MSEIEKGALFAPADLPWVDLRSGGRLDVLADGRRRRVVTYLAECDRPASLDELVVAIAAAETGDAPATLDETTTRSVAIALHHVHLPKLVQEGYVRATDDGLVLDVDPTSSCHGA